MDVDLYSTILGYLWVLQFLPVIKLTATIWLILLKVALNTITPL
jgi:hypothetical protein